MCSESKTPTKDGLLRLIHRTVVLVFLLMLGTLIGVGIASNESLAQIKSGTTFFNWKEEKPEPEESVNHIYQAKATYSEKDKMAFIDFRFYGDRQASFDDVSIDRSGKTVKVKLPDSTYIPSDVCYDEFGEFVKKMVVKVSGSKVIMTFTCLKKAEFTYATSNSCLHLRLMWELETSKTDETSRYAIQIPRPTGLVIDDVTQEDCYDAVSYKTAFKIILKGKHRGYFRKNPIVTNNKAIKEVKVSETNGGKTVIKVITKKLQGYRIERIGKYFCVTMGAPRKIYKNILVFDCGHGEHDSGAVYDGVLEKNLNLKMGFTLLHKYFTSPNSDIKVYWTRRTDKFVTLDDRAAFANKIGADAFISLHMNAADNRSANGTEVYYSVNNNKASKSGLKSQIMASRMVNALVKKLKTVDRSVRTAGFRVIKGNTVPAILIELGFLTGNQDHKRMITSKFQKKATATIYNVIQKLFEDYPSKR